MKKVLLLLSATTALCAANLNDLMPADVQKTTGVNRLSEKEKAALAEWLSTQMNGSQSGGNVTPEPESVERYLSENIQGGRVLRLSDNTMWEVSPDDITISRIWLFPFPVKIEVDEVTNPAYPYKFTNLRTGTTIHVKKL
ncbi:MAG: hypothetical protein KBC64_07265 [Simkaniaceae bacterium]|nr:hypothetical protein [Simkaniaceae bacterium]